ncbi:MAG: MATE family efflux transporter [Clostridia bacterium]|nr:MATE family efflux transporter [Clostridia bacterium]
MRHTLRDMHFEMDMLNGPVLPKILSFAVPLMLSSMLQLTFNAADVIVVGRFEGDAALAAVGAPGSLINLLVNLFLGMSVGANVLVAHCFGAGEYNETSQAVHTSIGLSLISGVLVGCVGFFFAGTFLSMMNTPPEVLPLATDYMRIYFLGMPANMLYNFGAAILRAIGDTRRPLIYLTIAGIVNVVLNLILVLALGMGVSGVALATILSQTISAVLVVLCLIRSDGAIQLHPGKIRLHREKVWRILKVGLPAGLQGIMFSISNVMVQSTVNGFGKTVVAGNTTSSNLEGYVYMAMNSISQAAITFTGQNVGAGRYERIPKIVKAALLSVLAISLSLGGLLIAGRYLLFHIYTDDAAVIAIASARILILVPPYFLCGMMDSMVGVLRGMGSSLMPMVVSVLGICVLRVVWILTVFPLFRSLTTVYLSYPVSWAVTLLAHFCCYLYIKHMRYDNFRLASAQSMGQ